MYGGGALGAEGVQRRAPGAVLGFRRSIRLFLLLLDCSTIQVVLQAFKSHTGEIDKYI